MDYFWLVTGFLFILAGIVGSLLPFLPGPPLSYIGLLLQQFRADPPFTLSFLLLFAAITVLVLLLDYIIPVYGTKRFGGSKQGMVGSTIGLVVGLFFGPWGILIGPLIGAFVGEMITHNNSRQAIRSALGSFAGFVLGTLLKLVVCVIMGWFLISSISTL